MRLITKIDRESDIWIVKIFHDIGNFFYDTTADDIKKYQIQFEKMTDIFFSYIEKQFGILNPVNENDWHEIILILIAQVSKRTDENGSVCLRPSQTAMILYSLLSNTKFSIEQRESLLNKFVNNL